MSAEKLYSYEGELLQDHLLNVATKTQEILDQTLPSDYPYREVILNAGYLIGLTHDLGKSTQHFQEYLSKGKKGVLTRYSALSSIVTFYVVSDYLNQQSLPDNLKTMLKALSVFIVKEQNSDLSNITEAFKTFDSNLLRRQIQSIDDKKLQEVLDAIGIKEWCSEKINTDTLKKWLVDFQNDHVFDLAISVSKILNKSSDLNYYFLNNMLFSALVEADIIDATIKTTIDVPNCIIEKDTIEKYQAKFVAEKQAPLSTLRQQAYQEAMDSIEQQIQLGLPNRLMLLTLPTGLGKTITSFAVANRMKTVLVKPYRIIYAVPFGSITEQIADVFADLIREQYNKEPTSDLLLSYHPLSDTHYKTDGVDYNMQQSSALIETWNSSVIVTTCEELIHTLISNKKSMLLKYNKLANSIIILDEVSALPIEYWKLVSNILNETLKALNSYAIVMDITKPLYFDGIPLVSNRYSTLNRYTIDASTYVGMETMEQFIRTFPIEQDKTYLFVMNTVREAEAFYDLLQTRVPKEKIGFLSSEIASEERRKTINEAKKGNIQFLVSTQAIEAGVDLDFHIVVRDFAPMVAIVQSAGRCNRDATSKGQVYITMFKNNANTYFADEVYDDVLLRLTYELIANKTVEEQEVRIILDQYIKKSEERKDTHTLSDQLYESIAKLKYGTYPASK